MNGVIQAIQEQEITLSSNTASLPFATTDLRTKNASCCGWMGHNEGSPLFNVLEGGVYKVNFNANITSNTAGTVAMALFSNAGVQEPGTEMDAVIAAPGDFENISFQKIIKVCCKGDAALRIGSVPSVVYSGGATPVITDTEIPILKNAIFSVERLN
jgi:hypothetical protein